MLNSLYGKFGLNPNVRGKYPILEDGIIKYKLYDKDIRDSIYLPVATFITSLARKKTIETSQKIKDYTINKYGKDYYIYSDTDSIHMIKLNEEELKTFIDIDDYKLGAWKIEGEFTRAKFIRQKCYIEQSSDGFINTTIAGLPKRMSSLVNFDNFKVGFTTENLNCNETGKKLTYKHVKGGVILEDTDFTIK